MWLTILIIGPEIPLLMLLHFLKAILSFEFVITLHVVERYMSFIESLMRSLQARELDIIKAVQHLISEIDTRFTSHSLTAMRCLALFHPASLLHKKTDDEIRCRCCFHCSCRASALACI